MTTPHPNMNPLKDNMKQEKCICGGSPWPGIMSTHAGNCPAYKSKGSEIATIKPTESMELPEGCFTECCRSDFDAFAYEKEPGIWQERCLKCKKLCEPRWFHKGEKATGVAKPLMDNPPTESMEQEGWESKFEDVLFYVVTHFELTDNDKKLEYDWTPLKSFIHKVRQEAVEEAVGDVEKWVKKHCYQGLTRGCVSADDLLSYLHNLKK